MIGLSNGANKASASISDIGNLWVWDRMSEVPASYELGVQQSGTFALMSGAASAQVMFYYSDSITVLSDGTPTLNNPKSIVINYDNYSRANTIKNKFWYTSAGSYFKGGTIYYGSFTTYSRDNSSGARVTINGYKDVITNPVSYSHNSYAVSSLSTEYPEDGQSGDYWYIRLGQIGGAARIETGSYVGTGTYGSSNPNSLTFGFAPKLFSIYGAGLTNLDNYQMFSLYDGNAVNNIVPFDILSTSYRKGLAPSIPEGASDNSYAKKSADGKTVSWYSADAECQDNLPGNSYFYFAIG